LKPVVEALEASGIKPGAIYIDRYGFLRVVYTGLTWEEKERVKAAARKHIAGGRREAEAEKAAVNA